MSRKKAGKKARPAAARPKREGHASASARVERGELTERQRRFVMEYLACGNATRAAERAGFENPNQYGPYLVNHGPVSKAIAEAAAKADARMWMSREERLVMLDRIARRLETEQTISSSGEVIETEPKIRDRIRAIETQAKMCGEITERREVTGKGGDAIKLDAGEVRVRAIAALKRVAAKDPRIAAALRGEDE
jgi:phage terminase small subunit